MPKLTKSGKVDKRTIKYVLLEYRGLDNTYYAASYDESKVPGYLEQLKAAGITECYLDEVLVTLSNETPPIA